MTIMTRTWRVLTPVLAAFLLLLIASTARAEYEQVPERFGTSGEGNLLLKKGVRGIAVNAAGVGGVPPGSFYAVTGSSAGGASVVMRFTPGTEGEAPQFEEAWGWEIGEFGAGGGGFQRCGPALTTEPAQHTFHTCANPAGGTPPSTDVPRHFSQLSGVAVDQSNGYVYVRNSSFDFRKNHLVEVFTATGAPVGEGFGDTANATSTPPESIAASPAKLHLGEAPYLESMTIDEDGTVYLTDEDFRGVENPIFRVMSFEPEGGSNFEHYVYTGSEKDLRVQANEAPTKIAWAGPNRLVTARFEQIHEYSVAPTINKPLCSLPISGNLTALTANPVTGEVIYFNEPKRSLVRLGACNEATGKFTQLQQLKPAPATENVQAIGLNPGLLWSSSRPAGTIYVSSEIETPALEFFGDIFATTPVLSPIVGTQFVANTGVTSTTFRAEINPRGLPTRYKFEYIPADTYEAQLAAAEGEGKTGTEAEAAAFRGALVAPSGVAELRGGAVNTVGVSVSGLTADTPYLFRAIASSDCSGPGEPLCVASGSAVRFSTYPATPSEPPDGRAYELVSPAEKNGGEVFPAEAEVGSCGAIVCKPPGGIPSKVNPMQSAPDGEAVAYMGYPFAATEGAVLNSYISRRTPQGWRTTSETPASQPTKVAGTFAYDEALLDGAVGESEGQILLRSATEPYGQERLVPSPRYRGAAELKAEYGGYSAGFSRQFFSANDSLTFATTYAPEPPDPGLSGADLYEWHGGSLSLINVLPGNAAVATAASFAGRSPDVHWVSTDGTRVFWRSGAHLYVREDGIRTQEVTHPGTFIAASEDGERVLLSDGCIYSVSSHECVDLTEGKGGFKGMSAATGDFSHVYFVDSAKLPAAGPNNRGVEAVPTKPNLYLYEAGAATRFIATLAPTDGEGGPPDLNDWGAASGLPQPQRTAEASGNGRYFTFVSTLSLTGYDNVGPCVRVDEAIVTGACKEVFLYDSATGVLTCPSCNPTGERPLGNSTLRRITSAKATFPQPRYLTNTGRLFFDSGDRLSAKDTNGGVEDVYELEPLGIGTCALAPGCVGLISTGTGSVDSNFLAMGGVGRTEGSDIFFTTRERLVSSDTDEQIDLYDAREGGGFPDEGEKTGSGCRGEACQPTVTPPAISAPGTSSFQGRGNPVRKKPLKCAKGKIEKGGKCVKRPKKAKRPSAKPKKSAQHKGTKTKHAGSGGAK